MDTLEGTEVKHHKTAGYVLLAMGLILIIMAVYLMFIVYTGATPPPSVLASKSIRVGGGSLELEINKLLNLGIWFVLMSFVASAGSRIGMLGVRLIREIKVEVKRDD